MFYFIISLFELCVTRNQILLGIQDLLDEPNVDDPAQELPYKLFKSDKKAYTARVL